MDRRVAHATRRPYMRRWAQNTVLIFLAIWAIGATGYVLHRPAPFDPLSGYDMPQPVDLDSSAVDLGASYNGSAVYPTLYVSSTSWPDVPVTGQKCSNVPVRTHGENRWQEVIPPGFMTAGVGGDNNRMVGCTPIHYLDRIPDQVRARITEQAAAGRLTSVWQIQGTDTPYGQPGQETVTHTWQTINFAIVFSR